MSEIEDFTKLYNECKKRQEIKRIMDITYNKYAACRRHTGLARYKKPGVHAEIKRLRKQGKKQDDIAKETGINQPLVSEILVPLRNDDMKRLDVKQAWREEYTNTFKVPNAAMPVITE